MAAATKVDLNHDEIQSYLDGGHGVEALLEAAADRVLSAAQSGAPVVTGAYRDGLHVETVHTDRMVKRVVSDADYAMVVEAETGNLARALDAAG
jgi:hypothetical protein